MSATELDAKGILRNSTRDPLIDRDTKRFTPLIAKCACFQQTVVAGCSEF